jgi:hypothetical protein
LIDFVPNSAPCATVCHHEDPRSALNRSADLSLVRCRLSFRHCHLYPRQGLLVWNAAVLGEFEDTVVSTGPKGSRSPPNSFGLADDGHVPRALHHISGAARRISIRLRSEFATSKTVPLIACSSSRSLTLSALGPDRLALANPVDGGLPRLRAD